MCDRGPLNTAFLGLGTLRYGVAVFPTVFAFVLEHAHFPKLAVPLVEVKLPAYSWIATWGRPLLWWGGRCLEWAFSFVASCIRFDGAGVRNMID